MGNSKDTSEQPTSPQEVVDADYAAVEMRILAGMDTDLFHDLRELKILLYQKMYGINE